MNGHPNEAEDAEREATTAELLNQCFEIWKDAEGTTHYSYYVGQGDDIRTIDVDEAWALAMGNDLYDFLAADRQTQKQKRIAEVEAIIDRLEQDLSGYDQLSPDDYVSATELRAALRGEIR